MTAAARAETTAKTNKRLLEAIARRSEELKRLKEAA
jgi:hypothetical protein